MAPAVHDRILEFMRLPVTGELNSGVWEGLLSACQPCLAGKDDTLELDLSSVDWSPPSGLVPLAALLNLVRSNGVNVQVAHYPAANVCSYYCRMDFFERIGAETRCEHKRASPAGRFIEISELRDAELHEDIAEQLSALLEAAPEATDLSRSSFIDACGELVSNTRHAYDVNVDPSITNRPGALIQAQYYPKDAQVEFCICDLGVGIKASLELTDKTGFRTNAEAITAAIMRGNRNHEQGGAGLGLAALADYIKKNSGSLTIRSGDALKTLSKKGVTVTDQLGSWPGTIIALKLNVGNETDLSRSWERMA
jgi:ABC-type transporter Mla MlaB component